MYDAPMRPPLRAPDPEQLQQAIIDGAAHLIVATDPDGVILDMNPAAERALGWRRAELVGKATPELFHDRAEVAAAAESLRAEMGWEVAPGFGVFVARASRGMRDEREWTYIARDGRRFPVLLSVTALRDAGGRLTGFVGISTDLSLRKAQEDALLQARIDAKARAAAERASETKSRFLAAASHDLRQPLQAVTLFLNVLALRVREPELRDVTDKALEALRIGDGLLGAMVEIANLDAGLVHPNPMAFPVQDVLDALVAQAREHAGNIAVTVRAVPSGAVVRSDPVMLQRILRLLIDNALRHAGSERILVGCRRTGGRLRIEVHDTGPGVPEDKLELIFEDFFQVGNAHRDRDRGLGLGLPVAQRLARLLGHEIVVRSRVGVGSVFAVVVPLA